MTKLYSFLILMMVLIGIGLPGEMQAASLRLSWTDNSDNEAGFKIERLTDSVFVEIGTVGTNATSYTDSGLTIGAIYCYRVRAFNSAGVSAPSNQACASPTDSTTDLLVTGTTSSSGSTSTSLSGSTSSSTTTSQFWSNWTDYRVTLKITSMDDDAIGVMFRYLDNRNYYRFSWDKERGSRRLEKLQNGVRTVLAEDAVPYLAGHTYQLQIVARGTTLEAWIDSAPVFLVIDSSFQDGTIALYSWYNRGSIFDDVLVEDLLTGEVLLSDDFDNGNFKGWTIVDEGTANGPSVWSAADGALAQSSNIGSDTDTKLGTFALYTKRNRSH